MRDEEYEQTGIGSYDFWLDIFTYILMIAVAAMVASWVF